MVSSGPTAIALINNRTILGQAADYTVCNSTYIEEENAERQDAPEVARAAVPARAERRRGGELLLQEELPEKRARPGHKTAEGLTRRAIREVRQ